MGNTLWPLQKVLRRILALHLREARNSYSTQRLPPSFQGHLLRTLCCYETWIYSFCLECTAWRLWKLLKDVNHLAYKQSHISCSCTLSNSPSALKLGSRGLLLRSGEPARSARRRMQENSPQLQGDPWGIPGILPVFQKQWAIHLLLDHPHPEVGLIYPISCFLENIKCKSGDMTTWRESLHLFMVRCSWKNFTCLGRLRSSQKPGAHVECLHCCRGEEQVIGDTCELQQAQK